jgi:hypothetical protein
LARLPSSQRLGTVGNFRKVRDLAAWLGLVPAEHSTGSKQTLLGISTRGNRHARRLIIHGARSCVLHLSRANHALGDWLSAFEARNRIGPDLHLHKGRRRMTGRVFEAGHTAALITCRPDPRYRLHPRGR